jgi:hypothetical protein
MTTNYTKKNTIFWDVAPCSYCVSRRFEGTYRLHLQGRLQSPANAVSLADFSTLKMEVISSSETSFHTITTITTQRHIPGNGLLYSHRCENFKPYKLYNNLSNIFSSIIQLNHSDFSQNFIQSYAYQINQNSFQLTKWRRNNRTGMLQ